MRAPGGAGRLQGLCCKNEADLVQLGEKRTRGPIMTEQHPFKWRHFQSDIILLCVRWYLRYALSYRDLEFQLPDTVLSSFCTRRRPLR